MLERQRMPAQSGGSLANRGNFGENYGDANNAFPHSSSKREIIMNIALLIIDTLRYDYIGANGNDWMQTPNLDRLASESWCFDNAFAASFPTIPYRRDVMTGRYGGPFHVWQPLSHDDYTLPWALGGSGYATQLIHDTPHLVNGGHNFDWPFHAWTFVRGAEVDRPTIVGDNEPLSNWSYDPLFDCLEEGAEWAPQTVSYAAANKGREKDEDWNCARLFLTASDFLKQNVNRENFFLWVDCFDPHEPWDSPREFMLKYDQTEGYEGTIDPRQFIGRNNPNLPEAARERVKATYSAKLTWMDHCLGKFLDTLDETGLAEKTAVILVGDHGTNNGHWGKFGKGSPIRGDEAHIPLFIRIPGGGSGRSSAFAQPQDYFATILGLAGQTPPSELDSQNLFELARNGEPGRRQLALSGSGSNHWNSEGFLFTAFDEEWTLLVHAKPEDSELIRRGTQECVESENSDVVERLHSAAIDEVERRGTDPLVMSWLRNRGEGPRPRGYKWPDKGGYCPYFQRLYKGE
jgi:arylsulfatase A-like enzyme